MDCFFFGCGLLFLWWWFACSLVVVWFGLVVAREVCAAAKRLFRELLLKSPRLQEAKLAVARLLTKERRQEAPRADAGGERRLQSSCWPHISQPWGGLSGYILHFTSDLK